ncbi:MAG TPA: N-acetylmuramoyl-L-alanine amidase [Firmicutes bacterium]|nr:N-acetylmuramoyl-L-alanine amidase [Bacillota bacterium]
MARAETGKNTVTLYANIWTTLLMLVFFFVSGISGGQPASQNRSPGVTTPPSDSRHALQGRVIVVDPGHGGADPGTIGLGYSTEAENVLAIAWELKGMLEEAGAKVIMTRKTNVNPAQGTSYANRTNGQLAARTAVANHNNAEIFVSIHNDWNGNSKISGTTSYYYHAHDWLLADSIQKQLVGFLGSRNVGVKRGNFYVLRNTSMPAVLIEVGFLSNQREAQLLAQPWYRTAAAKGIFYGIVDYYQRAGLM